MMPSFSATETFTVKTSSLLFFGDIIDGAVPFSIFMAESAIREEISEADGAMTIITNGARYRKIPPVGTRVFLIIKLFVASGSHPLGNAAKELP